MPDLPQLFLFICAGVILNLTPRPGRDVHRRPCGARWLDGVAGSRFIVCGVQRALTPVPAPA